MPLVITSQILKSADQMKIGWSLVKCISVKEQVTNNKSVTIMDFEGISGPGNSDDNKERLLSHFIYHAAINGDRPVPDVVADLIRMFAAFEECTIDEAKIALNGQELNFGEWVGRKVYIEVVDNVYEGKAQKRIRSWAPGSTVPF